jgi:hypothetical protein
MLLKKCPFSSMKSKKNKQTPPKAKLNTPSPTGMLTASELNSMIQDFKRSAEKMGTPLTELEEEEEDEETQKHK